MFVHMLCPAIREFSLQGSGLAKFRPKQRGYTLSYHICISTFPCLTFLSANSSLTMVDLEPTQNTQLPCGRITQYNCYVDYK